MPHVLVTGPSRVATYWERFAPAIERSEGRILRSITAYLACRENRVLVECTVMEGFLRQVFLIELLQRDDGALVRLFHGSSPEKTDGVRHCLAWIAAELRAQDPACSWNTEHLGMEIPSSLRSGRPVPDRGTGPLAGCG